MWDNQGHAPCKTCCTTNPHGSLLLWVPTSLKGEVGGVCLPQKTKVQPLVQERASITCSIVGNTARCKYCLSSHGNEATAEKNQRLVKSLVQWFANKKKNSNNSTANAIMNHCPIKEYIAKKCAEARGKKAKNLVGTMQ